MRSPEKITARREKIFSAGDLLAEAGTPVDSYLLAAVTAAGVRNLTVYKRLKSSGDHNGDELQNTETPLQPGKIYDANGIWLCTRLREMDCEVVRYQTAGDDQSKIADEIREAWKEADLILTTGGVSVGEKRPSDGCHRKSNRKRVISWDTGKTRNADDAFGGEGNSGSVAFRQSICCGSVI